MFGSSPLPKSFGPQTAQAGGATQPQQVNIPGTNIEGTSTTHITPSGLTYKATRVTSHNGQPLPHTVILSPVRSANFVAPNTPGTPQGTASGASALQHQMDAQHADMVNDYFSKYNSGDTTYSVPESSSGSHPDIDFMN